MANLDLVKPESNRQIALLVAAIINAPTSAYRGSSYQTLIDAKEFLRFLEGTS